MERPWKRTVVGSLDIVSALFAFLLCFLTAASLSALRRPLPSLRISLLIVAGFFAILGILALAGGICALLRRMWGLALAGSIAASISLPPLGIPATLFMLLSGEAPRLARLLVLVLLSPAWLVFLAALALVLLGYSL